MLAKPRARVCRRPTAPAWPLPLSPPVVAVGHAVDLALLTVADDSFWVEPTPMLPLALGDVPALQENVLVRCREGVLWFRQLT